MEKLKLYMKWSLGVGMILMGLVYLISMSIIGGLFFLIGSLFILPPSLKMIEEKSGKSISNRSRNFAIVLCVIAGFGFVTVDQMREIEQKDKREQEAYDNLPQHVKDSLNSVQARQDSLAEARKELQRIEDEKQKRREVVEKQFSQWDGSHPGLSKLIKKSMNDPDSYEHVETRFRDDGESIFIITEFRGKNAFGGTIKNTVTARVDFQGNVIEVISQN